MKTIELKWIEDDNHVVAEDAFTGMKELIDTGVFPDLEVKCEDDVLYITGEKEDLDKAVMKIQKDYAKYGQIMIKEAKNGVSQELRIESFDDNVQDIFNHTLADYETFKSTKKKPLNYVKQLNDYRMKFKKFYETASRSDKKLLKPYLEEISNLLDESEFMPKIKPIKKINEDSLDDFDDREINASIAAQAEEVKKFVKEQQYLIYNYIKTKWISLCEKYKIERTTYYEVSLNTLYGNGQQPGSTLFIEIKIADRKQFYKAINIELDDTEEAEEWLNNKLLKDCPFDVSRKPDIYRTDSFGNRSIRIGIKIPEYTPKKPRKPRKPRDPNKGYKKPNYVNPDMKGGNYFDGDTQVYEMPEENEAFMNKMSKKICEAACKKVINPETIGTIDVVIEELQNLGYGPFVSKALVKDHRQFVIEMLNSGSNPFNIAKALDKQYMNEDANNDVRKHLSNPRNWGIVEESLSNQEYNDKYDEVALLYAKETGMDLDDAYDELLDVDELVNWIEGPYDVDEIVYKLMNESLNESFLSAGELKKKLQRVAARWASIQGVTFEVAYNDLRKKKSVKDMLDFYSVDEIIDELSKNIKEVDDELEEEI